MPEMVLSSSFLLHFRSPFGYALPYGFKPKARFEWEASHSKAAAKYLVFWYLVLKFFTLRSLPLKNCLNLVFKVRYLSVTGFFEWLITLSTVLNNTTYLTRTQYKATHSGLGLARFGYEASYASAFGCESSYPKRDAPKRALVSVEEEVSQEAAL
jgi:hypothetical protein